MILLVKPTDASIPKTKKSFCPGMLSSSNFLFPLPLTHRLLHLHSHPLSNTFFLPPLLHLHSLLLHHPPHPLHHLHLLLPLPQLHLPPLLIMLHQLLPPLPSIFLTHPCVVPPAPPYIPATWMISSALLNAFPQPLQNLSTCRRHLTTRNGSSPCRTSSTPSRASTPGN